MGRVRWWAGWVAAASALLLGCAVSPVGQRPRVAELPLAATQAEWEFTIRADLRTGVLCRFGETCQAEPQLDVSLAARFEPQVQRIGRTLSVGARALYPGLAERLPTRPGGPFVIAVVAGRERAAASSADGRIVLDARLAAEALDDEVLAFILAREMAHVLARHHAENASTSFVLSAVFNLILPGSSALKTVLAAGGARLATRGNAAAQAVEADLMASELIGASGYRPAAVATALKKLRLHDDASPWSREFQASAATFIAATLPSDAALVGLTTHPAPTVSLTAPRGRGDGGD